MKASAGKIKMAVRTLTQKRAEAERVRPSVAEVADVSPSVVTVAAPATPGWRIRTRGPPVADVGVFVD